MSTRFRWLLVPAMYAFIFLLCWQTVAIAAPPVPLPSSVDPGRVEQHFQKAPEPQAKPAITVPEPAEQLPPDQAEAVRFVLSAIEVEGATVYSREQLLPLWQEFLGKEISLLQVYRIADAITAKYRNAGYILSQAIVPPQKIEGGIVHIKVIEGYVNEVVIEGDVQARSGLFREWAEKIKASRPLDNAVLERYSLLANDLAGVKVSTVLKPSATAPGASDLVLAVTTDKALGANATVDNRGTKTSGPVQYSAGLTANSLLNLFERTSVNYSTTSDFRALRYFSVNHDEVLTSEGTKLSLTASQSLTRPDDYLEVYEIKGDSVSAGFTVGFPLLRSRSQNFTLAGGFTLRNSQTDTLGQLQSHDRIRELVATMNYDLADTYGGVNMATLGFYQGMNILNATEPGSPNLTRVDGHSDFSKLTAYLSRKQELGHNFSLEVAATGQYAFMSLLSSEEFGYGGSQFGRAYDSSEITGDSGMAARAELQYTGSPDALQVRYLQPYLFYDYGAIWNRSDTRPDHQDGASAGLGLRLAVTDYLSGSVELTKPLTRDVAAELPDDGKEPRIFFTATARY
ncbi:MAG: ShlB/FhaC/HecB family hemolysin secretion/activation protein [Betaproteobacteria bacterium HGW-Betaproteobacteria-18]|nr:MAG: ShlB/FhaC/HecB family hemolysin secretion/activation protein [Deltaproteobacteria bacterium HGW-Deltaproteobacteria-3]PKO59188.1 MAG: ShlB/FhaC/HecB family hemolysin secretion/activation protein [Betaproteobacteria bacterium HGW-Betaproteobacteria-18]